MSKTLSIGKSMFWIVAKNFSFMSGVISLTDLGTLSIAVLIPILARVPAAHISKIVCAGLLSAVFLNFSREPYSSTIIWPKALAISWLGLLEERPREVPILSIVSAQLSGRALAKAPDVTFNKASAESIGLVTISIIALFKSLVLAGKFFLNVSESWPMFAKSVCKSYLLFLSNLSGTGLYSYVSSSMNGNFFDASIGASTNQCCIYFVKPSSACIDLLTLSSLLFR